MERTSGGKDPLETKLRRQKPTRTRRTKSNLTEPADNIGTTATG